jgi:hypothetical protein
MKKILLGILTIVTAANYASAQGEVQLQNTSTSTSKIFTNGVAGGQSTVQVGAVAPGNATMLFTFALFVSTTTNAVGSTPSAVAPSTTPFSSASWNFTSDYATNTALTGRIAGVDNGLGYEVINGLAAGINANLELIGWNTAVGGSTLASFMAAYNSQAAGLFYGYSGVANITLGDNGANYLNSYPFISPSSGGITGFTLAPLLTVPEPGTMALAALSGASLLLFRRRK